jgi:hypothetical protein
MFTNLDETIQDTDQNISALNRYKLQNKFNLNAMDLQKITEYRTWISETPSLTAWR